MFISVQNIGRSIPLRHLLVFEICPWQGSSTIGPEENCPPIPKLTLTQTLTLTRGHFSPGQLSGCPPTLKITLTLTETPTLTGGGRGVIFLGGAIVRILHERYVNEKFVCKHTESTEYVKS